MWRANGKFFLTCMAIGLVLGIAIAVLMLSTSLRGHFQYVIYLSIAVSLGILVYAAYVIIKSSGKIKVATHQEYKCALSFKNDPDKAVLYLMRPQFLGFARALPVYINHKELWLKGKMFYRLVLPSGTYTMSGNKACQNDLALDLKAGKIYFVEQQMMASMFKTGYQHVLIEDAEKGEQGVMNCKKMLILLNSK